ncbi:hypothetical protein [Pontibacter sp. G13]|uniref:hypothetical protein n=1 Tax=Pontibacter sp. G13 TaxID=3074898 RepID=UPI00288A91BA|nr:hypothetical protein [Pontibacter sp. G13]WNJ21549.1 hypothetical protein RJD25_28735 [Pontibacter sp. G13]
MIRLFRLTPVLKTFVVLTLGAMVGQLVFPSMGFALTGGPSSPEFSSFEPVGTSNMVDLSTGDFTYNIPLMDVEGYPINISYHSGITMDQEATVVGLGWTLNTGSLNRNKRGLADDFDGSAADPDIIEREMNIRPNRTVGGKYETSFELFGGNTAELGLGFGVFYNNNYQGWGYEYNVSPSLNFNKMSKEEGEEDIEDTTTVSLGVNIGYKSDTGFGLSPSLGIGNKIKKTNKAAKEISSVSWKGGIGASYNSRGGIQALTFSGSNTQGITKDDKSTSDYRGFNSAISFSTPTYNPSSSFPFLNEFYSFGGTFGTEFFGGNQQARLTGYIGRQQKLKTNQLSHPAFGYFNLDKSESRKYALQDFNREKDTPFMKWGTRNLPLANLTYDLFSASGHGIGGQFRAHRGDVGMVHDPLIASESVNGSLGVDFGGGNSFKFGGSINLNITTSHTGGWKFGNKIFRTARFLGKSQDDPLFEPVYFKRVGELNGVSDNDFIANLGDDGAVRPTLGNVGGNVGGILAREDGSIAATYSGDDFKRSSRNRRSQAFTTLTAEEASIYGLTKKLRMFSNQGFRYHHSGAVLHHQEYDRYAIGSYRKGHHVSEVQIVSGGGSRYVYGLPAYNISTEEVSYNTSDLTEDGSGIISYNALDASIYNKSGVDHYYNRESTGLYLQPSPDGSPFTGLFG